MSVASIPLILTRAFGVTPGQSFELGGVGFDGYEAIADALPDCRSVKIVYLDGSLTLLTTSRRHDWISDRLGELVREIANGLQIPWDTAGRATFRRASLSVGIEGDQTFYFGDHARLMRGGVNIDLELQPPPDLAIEVEVTHRADETMRVWGRLGVPEVWCFDEASSSTRFWLREEDGSYRRSRESACFPKVTTEDIDGRLRLADDMVSSEWQLGLQSWVRDVLLPRQSA